MKDLRLYDFRIDKLFQKQEGEYGLKLNFPKMQLTLF